MHAMRRALPIHLVVAITAACGSDLADDAPPDRPTYVEDIAPILDRACATCHGAPTGMSEAQNCVRVDHWDTTPDPMRLCSDPATGGTIFGVRDGGAMIVDNVVTLRMPVTGPLSAPEIETFRRWGAAGYPKRAINQPPSIQFLTPPSSGATVCQPGCAYAIDYTIADPDGDSVRWSLAWSDGARTSTLVAGLPGGSGTVMIDATTLASGTYRLAATLDDGTAMVTSMAAGTLTVPAGHNAAPTVTVSAPDGGESYYANQPVTISWLGGDLDDAQLTYDVSATGSTTIAIRTLTAPVGPAQLTWMTPQVTGLASFRIQVVARDDAVPPATATDRSNGEFSISPPPQAVSFATQLQPIFNASCVDARCHDAAQPAAGLVLTTGASHGALVGVPSTQAPCTSYQLVEPGQPDRSYLVFKLQGSGACSSGSRMPKAMPALTATQIQLFRDWVANGAPNT
jgi:hypothetical protein